MDWFIYYFALAAHLVVCGLLLFVRRADVRSVALMLLVGEVVQLVVETTLLKGTANRLSQENIVLIIAFSEAAGMLTVAFLQSSFWICVAMLCHAIMLGADAFSLEEDPLAAGRLLALLVNVSGLAVLVAMCFGAFPTIKDNLFARLDRAKRAHA